MRKKSMSEKSQSVEANDETFAKVVMGSDVPVLVDFWAPWCGPCHAIAPMIEELAGKYADRVKFVKVNVDEGQRTAMSLGIMNIPTVMLFSNGKPIDRQVGIPPKAVLSDMVEQCLFRNAHPASA